MFTEKRGNAVAEEPEWLPTVIIGCVLFLTVFLGVTLPFLVNIPALPVVFYKIMSGSPPQLQMTKDPINQTSGLLIHYDFENDFIHDGRVMDRSGNNKIGQVKGLVREAPGIGNHSISLNGMGYILSGDNPAAGLTNVSFSLWFKTSDPTGNYKMVSAATTGDTESGWTLSTRISEFLDDEGKAIFSAGVQSRPNNFLPDAWNHKVVTYDGIRVKDYTNGQLVNDWPATGAPIGAGKMMVVGVMWQPFGFNYAGQIDDFRIHGHALGKEEIIELYQQNR